MNLISIATSLLILYLILVLFIYLYQRKLLYHPSENNYLDETNLNHKIEKIYIKEYYDLKQLNYDVYYIGKGFLRVVIFNFISCNYMIMTMTDLGNNLNKSLFCKNYLKFQKNDRLDLV